LYFINIADVNHENHYTSKKIFKQVKKKILLKFFEFLMKKSIMYIIIKEGNYDLGNYNLTVPKRDDWGL